MKLDNPEDMAICLTQSWKDFDKERNSFGLEEQAHEQALCHRLGVHIERYIEKKIPKQLSLNGGDLIVDVEYNRMGPERVPKGMEHEFNELINRLKEIYKSDKKSNDKITHVRPDIILHRRGENDHNLLAIEAKHTRPKGYEWEAMLLKMKFYREQLNYHHVVYVQLGKPEFIRF